MWNKVKNCLAFQACSVLAFCVNMFTCFISLPFWWQEPCCSNGWSLYPGSQIPPRTRCRPAARAGWCARREVSSSPLCLPSLPPPSHYQLSGPAFWVRRYKDYHRSHMHKYTSSFSITQKRVRRPLKYTHVLIKRNSWQNKTKIRTEIVSGMSQKQSHTPSIISLHTDWDN